MVIEVGLVGVQEVINGYRSCLLVPKGLYCAWKWCRLTADGVIHETLTIKDNRLGIIISFFDQIDIQLTSIVK